MTCKACFELGIKLGALFHQFLGLPISLKNVEIVERAIESCVSLQPYVEDVRVEIDREVLKRRESSFGYATLDPEMLKAEVVVNVDGVRVKGLLRWVEEMRYPLMSFELVNV